MSEKVQHLRGGSPRQDPLPRILGLLGDTPSVASEPSKVVEGSWNPSLVWVQGGVGLGGIWGGPSGNF